MFGWGNSKSTASSTTTIGAASTNTGGGNLNGATASGQNTKSTSVASGAVSTIADIGGTGNTVQILDAGAVSQSMSLALKGVELANANTTTTIDKTAGLLSGIFDKAASSNATLSQAVADTKAPDGRVMVIGALAIVAGLFVFMRKG